MVQCTKCKETKAPTEFRTDLKKLNGLRSDCRECERARARIWQKETQQYKRWKIENPERQAVLSEKHAMARYGITVEDYQRMLGAQGGVCAICGSDDPKMRKGARQRFCVDHDHETGRVRGLLCMPCNTALGGFRDDPERLRKAVTYLEVSLTGF